MGFERRDITSIHQDLPRGWAQCSTDQVHHGGFSGAIGTDQGCDATGLGFKRGSVDSPDAAEVTSQISDPEKGLNRNVRNFVERHDQSTSPFASAVVISGRVGL